jgi:hypothetical protein
MNGGGLYLGHDEAQERISVQYLLQRADDLFIHCKDIDSLQLLIQHDRLNVFGHSHDDFVVTSRGNVFCAVGIIQPGCVCVMPELYNKPITADMVRCCSHVVTDYPERYAI